MDWSGSAGRPIRFVKARGTRSQNSRAQRSAVWRVIAGPLGVCRSCGGAREARGLACIPCDGSGLA